MALSTASNKPRIETASDKPEIVFFDIETTGRDENSSIIEFGAILLCPNTLKVKGEYRMFIRPADPTRIRYFTDRENGITREAVASACTFDKIADEVYRLLHGRIWAGHNIRQFDAPLIEKAFDDINRRAPKPKAIFDSYELLRPGFARRVGRMKLASLAEHFNLGEQKHRSLTDCQMNLAVVKSCATVLFLESSLPDIFKDNILVSPDDIDLERFKTSTPPISVTLADPLRLGPQQILFLNGNSPLKLFCEAMMVCFDIGAKFTDHLGQPRLNFMVYAPEKLCTILDICDSLAKKLSIGCGTKSKWQPVMQTDCNNFPIVRLNVPFDGRTHRLATKIYEKDDSGEKLVVINTSTAGELDHLLVRGKIVDACFYLDTYDYNQKAGIKLFTEKLIVHCSFKGSYF